MSAIDKTLTWEKSPFLGRLKLEKSTGRPQYMSMCTSVVVLVVLLFKWYCLTGKRSNSLVTSLGNMWFKIN